MFSFTNPFSNGNARSRPLTRLPTNDESSPVTFRQPCNVTVRFHRRSAGASPDFEAKFSYFAVSLNELPKIYPTVTDFLNDQTLHHVTNRKKPGKLRLTFPERFPDAQFKVVTDWSQLESLVYPGVLSPTVTGAPGAISPQGKYINNVGEKINKQIVEKGLDGAEEEEEVVASNDQNDITLDLTLIPARKIEWHVTSLSEYEEIIREFKIEMSNGKSSSNYLFETHFPTDKFCSEESPPPITVFKIPYGWLVTKQHRMIPLDCMQECVLKREKWVEIIQEVVGTGPVVGAVEGRLPSELAGKKTSYFWCAGDRLIQEGRIVCHGFGYHSEDLSFAEIEESRVSNDLLHAVEDWICLSKEKSLVSVQGGNSLGVDDHRSKFIQILIKKDSTGSTFFCAVFRYFLQSFCFASSFHMEESFSDESSGESSDEFWDVPNQASFNLMQLDKFFRLLEEYGVFDEVLENAAFVQKWVKGWKAKGSSSTFRHPGLRWLDKDLVTEMRAKKVGKCFQTEDKCHQIDAMGKVQKGGAGLQRGNEKGDKITEIESTEVEVEGSTDGSRTDHVKEEKTGTEEQHGNRGTAWNWGEKWKGWWSGERSSEIQSGNQSQIQPQQENHDLNLQSVSPSLEAGAVEAKRKPDEIDLYLAQLADDAKKQWDKLHEEQREKQEWEEKMRREMENDRDMWRMYQEGKNDNMQKREKNLEGLNGSKEGSMEENMEDVEFSGPEVGGSSSSRRRDFDAGPDSPKGRYEKGAWE